MPETDKYQYRTLTTEQEDLAMEIMSLMARFSDETGKPGNFTDNRWLDRRVYENKMSKFGD